MVTPQILVLLFRVRVPMAQQQTFRHHETEERQQNGSRPDRPQYGGHCSEGEGDAGLCGEVPQGVRAVTENGTKFNVNHQQYGSIINNSFPACHRVARDRHPLHVAQQANDPETDQQNEQGHGGHLS